MRFGQRQRYMLLVVSILILMGKSAAGDDGKNRRHAASEAATQPSDNNGRCRHGNEPSKPGLQCHLGQTPQPCRLADSFGDEFDGSAVAEKKKRMAV